MNELFYIDDKTSAYAATCLLNKFPVGKYVILTERELVDVVFESGQFHCNGSPLAGVALVKVQPPDNMMYPFLLYRTKNNVVVSPLCRFCADNTRQTPCRHGPKNRAWIGTYTLSDLNFAKSIGYSFTFYECYHYARQDFLLKSFISCLFYRRICVSGFPTDCQTCEKQLIYCQTINKSMQFSGALELSPCKISYDPPKSILYKSFMNEFVGKFAQKRKMTKTQFVSTSEEIAAIFWDPTQEIEGIDIPNDTTCQLNITQKQYCKGPSRKTNCIIAAYITSNSRIFMQKKMLEIVMHGGTLFYTSTDSIYYSLPKQMNSPLSYGPCVLDFKREYGMHVIMSFYSVGPKETCVSFCTEEGIKTDVKVRGLALLNIINLHRINAILLEQFLKQFVQKKAEFILVPQVRRKRKSFFGTQYKTDVKFTNRGNTKRILCISKDKCFVTLPLGYTRNMRDCLQ